MLNITESIEAVKHPGRYQGENPATHYYDNQEDGSDDSADSPVEGYVNAFKVSEEEAKAFGLPLPWYIIKSTNYGFIIGENITEAQWQEICHDVDSASEDC